MENNPSQTLPGGVNVAPTVGGENVSEETVALHELINKELGTQYADDDSALKGLKETKSYVGRVGQFMPYADQAVTKGVPISKLFEAMDNVINGQPQPQAPASPTQADTDKFVTKDELNRQLFYKDNPQFAPHKSVIDAVAKAEGISPAEAVKTDALKNILDAAKGFDDVQKSKSILQSNPKLGMVSDNMTKAAEAMKSGDQPAAVQNAVAAVIEAYDLR